MRAMVSPRGGETMLPHSATRTAWKTMRFLASRASGSGSSAPSMASGVQASAGTARSASRAASRMAPMPSLARPLATDFSSYSRVSAVAKTGAATLTTSAGNLVRGFTMAARASIQASSYSTPPLMRPASWSSGTMIWSAKSASVMDRMYSAWIQSSFLGSKVAGFLETWSRLNLEARTSRGTMVVSPSSDQPRSAR